MLVQSVTTPTLFLLNTLLRLLAVPPPPSTHSWKWDHFITKLLQIMMEICILQTIYYFCWFEIWDFLLRSLNKLLELQKSQFIQSTENTFTHRTVSLLSRCCRTVSLKSAMMSYTTPAPFIAPTNNVPIWAGLLETITLAFSRASILDPAVPWRIFKIFVNSNLSF